MINVVAKLTPTISMEPISLGTRAALWGGAWLVTWLAAPFLPTGSSTVVLGGAVYDLASRVNPVAESAIATVNQPTQHHPSRRSNLSIARWPANINTMTPQQIEAYNKEEPIKFILECGGRVGISMDAQQLSLETVLSTLFYAHARKPHLWRLDFVGYLGDGSDLLKPIGEFRNLGYLSFRNCPQLSENVVRSLIKQNRPSVDDYHMRINHLHLEGCTSLSKSFCEGIAKEFGLMITYPDGTSNEEEMKRAYFQIVKDMSASLLQLIVTEKRKKMSATSPRWNELVALDEALKSIRKGDRKPQVNFKELLVKLHPVLDPNKFDESLKAKVLEMIQERARDLSEHNGRAVLDSPFTLDLRRMIASDDMVELFFARFQKLNAYLTHLDISESLIEGHFLKRAQGLPIQSLIACRLKHLSNEALEHLAGFSDLIFLDLSESPLNDRGLIRGVKRLCKVRSLHLNGCTHFTEEGLLKAVRPMISVSLEHLSIEAVPHVNQETINLFVVRGGEDMTRPFIVTSTSEGKRRLDISSTRSIYDSLINTFRFISKGEPITIIAFGEGTQLCDEDFTEKLYSQPLLKIEVLDLKNVEIKATQALSREWPLRRVRFKDAEIEIKGKNGDKAAEIHVKARQLTAGVFSFLEGLTEIGELHLTIDTFGEKREHNLTRLSCLCAERKTKKLVITGSDLAEGDLEDLASAPKLVMRRLMSVCDVIELQIPTIKTLFNDWVWDLNSDHACIIRTGGDNVEKTYSHN